MSRSIRWLPRAASPATAGPRPPTTAGARPTGTRTARPQHRPTTEAPA